MVINPDSESLLNIPVRHQRVDAVAVRREAPQHDLLGVLDLLRVTVAPLERHVTIGIGVHQHVECAVAVEHRQESDGSGDLTEKRLDFLLDLCLCLLGGGSCFRSSSVVAVLGCRVLLAFGRGLFL